MSAESDLPPPPAARRLTLVGSAVDGLRRAATDGAGQFVAWEIKLPEGASKVRQFVHGFWLPVVVARTVLSDARVRGRWLRYSVAQVAATLLVAVLALAIGFGRSDDKASSATAREVVAVLVDRAEERAGELERRGSADRALVRAEQELIADRLSGLEERLEGRGKRRAPMPDELPILVARALDDAALERAASQRAEVVVAVEGIDGEKLKESLKHEVWSGLERLAGGQREAAAAGEEPSFDLKEARSLDARQMEQEIRRKAQAGEKTAVAPKEAPVAALAHLLESVRKEGLPPQAPKPPSGEEPKARKVRAELKAAAMSAVPDAEAKLESSRPWARQLAVLGISWRLLGWLVALWGVLYGAQFVVIALCRDYHSELSREACLLTGIAPEDPPRRPLPRFDLRWALLRAKRQLRGWWVITLGLPMCWLVSLPFPGDGVRNAVIAAWILYWQVVFAASKSQRAWVDEFVAPAPWFLRAWRWVVEKAPLLWMLGAGVYLRFWERFTRSLYAPAECVEQLPAPFVGLTIFRLLGSVPLVKVFIRPLIPVASALLLEAYREHHPARTAPVVLQAEPVLAPATARAS
ncbi:MAG TPA: hypothetical protein VIG99_00380 [Myxococcaceae bacterium]